MSNKYSQVFFLSAPAKYRSLNQTIVDETTLNLAYICFTFYILPKLVNMVK
jgi:hypothetical protein